MKTYIRILFISTLLLAGTSIFAQEEDENPDTPPGDPGEVPIGDYVPLLIIGAAVLAFRFLPKVARKQA